MSKTGIEVTFAHPRTDRTFAADVGSAITAEQCIEELIAHGFLEALPADDLRYYALSRRTGHAIPSSGSLLDARVGDGETLLVAILRRGST